MLYKIATKFYTKYLLAILSVVGGYLSLYFIHFYLQNQNQHTTVCPFKLITGLPCPGCGMGRASLAIFEGELVTSFHYNILGIPFTIIIFTSLLWMIRDLILKQETFFVFIKREISLPYKLLIFGSLCASWVVNIIRGV